jgi:hypothetical protein
VKMGHSCIPMCASMVAGRACKYRVGTTNAPFSAFGPGRPGLSHQQNLHLFVPPCHTGSDPSIQHQQTAALHSQATSLVSANASERG